MLHRPRVVFLDEPTSGVDPISRRRFWQLIDEMSADGITVFVTTHYLDEAEYCHRLALIHAGRLVALGTVSELKSVFAGRRGARGRGAAAWATRSRRSERSRGCSRPRSSARGSTWWSRTPRQGRRQIEQCLRAKPANPAASVERIVPSLEDVFIHHVERPRRRSARRRPR